MCRAEKKFATELSRAILELVMGAGKGRARRARSAAAPASTVDVRKRLGELRPPKELRDFMKSFGGYYPFDEKATAAEIVTAIPDGADIVKAIDHTALWLLTNRKYGIAVYVPKDSPNQKPLRALKRLVTKKINGEYVDEEDFAKISPQFIYDTTWPGSIEETKEMYGWTPPKYKAGPIEQCAIMAAQECLCDYENYNRLADAMSWIAEGDGSSADQGMDDTPTTREAFQALIDAFKANVNA